jgi:S1-C subfamily serine protease
MTVEIGKGVPQDYRESVKWYRKAAEQGHAKSQYFLGLAYYHGRGVTQNFMDAYIWLNLAAAQGDQDATEARNSLLEIMSPQQIAEAQRKSAEYSKPKDREKKDGESEDDSTSISGTGFFITEDGYFVTNYHVIKNARTIKTHTPSGSYNAQVVKYDIQNDLAILKTRDVSGALPISRSSSVRLGSSVFTIGFPNIYIQGSEPKYTQGRINSLSGIQDDPRCFQISVPLQPGNSGGPLLDEKGNVVGVVTSKLDDAGAFAITGSLPQNVNYAVNSSYLLALIESIPELANNLKNPVTETKRDITETIEETKKSVVLIQVR